MDTLSVIEQISTDFSERNPPFDTVTFPEERLIKDVSVMVGGSDEPTDLSIEDRLRLVSAFATFDYNRDANQLVDKLIALQKGASHLFDPWEATNEDEIENTFESLGFRYPSRDAHAWAKNCRILRETYHGKWHELLLSTGLDAVKLVQTLEDDDFNCLKGVKIAPMYARIINDEVCELTKLWELDIAVDTHIRKLSKEIFQEDLTDDEIREHWYMYAISNDIDRHIVDGAMWQIGNNFDEWGEDYLKDVTGLDEFDHL